MDQILPGMSLLPMPLLSGFPLANFPRMEQKSGASESSSEEVPRIGKFSPQIPQVSEITIDIGPKKTKATFPRFFSAVCKLYCRNCSPELSNILDFQEMGRALGQVVETSVESQDLETIEQHLLGNGIMDQMMSCLA